MKNTLSSRLHAMLISIFISVLMLVQTQAQAEIIKYDKYTIGINLKPLSICAIWKDLSKTDYYQFRVVNEAELRSLLKKVVGKNEKEIEEVAKQIPVTRKPIDVEIALCKEVQAIAEKPKVWRVAKNGKYKTRPVYTTDLNKKTKHRAAVGWNCGKLIKKINSKQQWRYRYFDRKPYAVVCE